MKKKKFDSISIITAITFGIMVLLNTLANVLPINGQNTGQISDKYANLFAPAGYTFSIWGLIYLLLGLYEILESIKLLVKGKSPLTNNSIALIKYFSKTIV